LDEAEVADRDGLHRAPRSVGRWWDAVAATVVLHCPLCQFGPVRGLGAAPYLRRADRAEHAVADQWVHQDQGPALDAGGVGEIGEHLGRDGDVVERAPVGVPLRDGVREQDGDTTVVVIP